MLGEKNIHVKIMSIGQGFWPFSYEEHTDRHTDEIPNARPNTEISLASLCQQPPSTDFSSLILPNRSPQPTAVVTVNP